MLEKFYQTTTLPYVNDEPHIGHALEFIQADVVARYMRKKIGEENVWFNVGADENGLKMFQKAKEAGLETQTYVDKFSDKWKEFCKLFMISYDTFYRTSDPSHHEMAKKRWIKSREKGDIYKKKYLGLYCVGCEEFKTEKQLVDGKCPEHGKEPIAVSEENYFFRLSKYREKLLKWLNSNNVLLPSSKKAELKNWIKNMEDISVSRLKKNLPWGVEVPDDPEQVMYVWFDALTDYINVLENPSSFVRDSSFNKEIGIKKWWPGVQFFGPDNLRFQGGIWQGMLASFDLPHTKKLLSHGMILASDGTKMSKTKGNGISPLVQKDKFGVEAVRFYLIAGISTFTDSPYKEDDLINFYNSHLANNYGNLLNRVLHLKAKFNLDKSKPEESFLKKVNSFKKSAELNFDNFDLQNGVLKIIELTSFGNEYISVEKPWDLNENGKVQIIIDNLLYLLEIVSKLYLPILPTSAKKALEMISNNKTGVLFEKL